MTSDRFTGAANESLPLARSIAFHAGASETGLVHLLAAVARDEHYVAARAFAYHDIEYPAFRGPLGLVVAPCDGNHQVPPFATSASKAIGKSLDEAVLSGFQDITTGHIAAAVLASPDEDVLALLDAVRVLPSQVRDGVYRVLSEDPEAVSRESPQPFESAKDRADFERLEGAIRRQHLGFWKGYVKPHRNDAFEMRKKLGF